MAARARRLKGHGPSKRGAGNHQAENNQFAHQQHSVAGDQRLRHPATADRGQLERLQS